MEKIEFTNYEEPGLSAEILNELQDNIEGAIVGEDWKTLELSSYFKAYNNNDSHTPRYKKSGDLVQLTGEVSPTKSIKGSQDTYEIGTLPKGYRPSHRVRQLCQGSSYMKWMLSIETSGGVYFSRYSTDVYETATTSTWLPFSILFFTT